MQAVREGGIFASLWELAERAGVGLHIDLMKIPMDQTVVEICNYYDLNPYEILSSGSALLFAKQGQQLCEELAAIGIPAAVIGQTEMTGSFKTERRSAIWICQNRIRSEKY